MSKKFQHRRAQAQPEKRFVDVGPLFITDAQSPKLIETGERPLDYTPPSAQSTDMFGVTEPRFDAASTQTSTDCLGVITAIA